MPLFVFFIIFFLASSSNALVSPLIIKISKKYNLLDEPSRRKQHIVPISRIGGISIMISFIVAVFSLFLLNNFYEFLNFNFIYLSKGKLLCIGLFFLVGLFDDLYNLSPIVRLILQVIISAILWFIGIQINNIDFSIFNSSFSSLEISNISSLIVTILWIAGITNAFNWIDGLDGLASSISLISSTTLMIFCLALGNYDLAIILTAIAGCNFGFLPFNKYPAKLLMGDSGSYFIGFTFAIMSIMATNYISSSKESLSIFIPFFILFIPLIDMFFVILKRLLNGKSPFLPDRNHIHHRILKNGFSHQATVKLIIFFDIFICFTLISIMGLFNFQIYLFLSLIILIYFFVQKIIRNKKLFN